MFRSPWWGGGVGHRAQSLGPYCLVGSGGGSGAGLNGDCGRGISRPRVSLAGGGGGLWGVDDGALGDGDVDEGLDGVVLGGRLCSGGSRWSEGSVVCGGSGVLVWVGVWVSAVSLGLSSLRLWCCGLPGWCWWWCWCWWCARLGAGLGLGSGFGLRSGSRLRGTSVRRCEGAGAGWGVFSVCCRAA